MRAVQLLSEASRKLKTGENYYHLGKAYELAGNAGECRRAIERALALSSDFDGADDARALLAALPTRAPESQ